jgi:hypothetical protein
MKDIQKMIFMKVKKERRMLYTNTLLPIRKENLKSFAPIQKEVFFHHKSSVGVHVVDYKNVHLIKKVHSPLKRKAGEIAAEESVKIPTALKEIINMSSIKELETKPCLFNRTLA